MEQATMMASDPTPTRLGTLKELQKERQKRKVATTNSNPRVVEISAEIEANLRMMRKLAQANEILMASRDNFIKEAEEIFDQENPFTEELTEVAKIEAELNKSAIAKMRQHWDQINKKPPPTPRRGANPFDIQKWGEHRGKFYKDCNNERG